jgi:predicted kinase
MQIPANGLVVLIGAAGSGKSAFARRTFPSEAIVSSDELRRSIRTTGRWRRYDVFDQLLQKTESRLMGGMLTVVDATNTDWMRRADLIRLARRHGRPAIAIVFALPLEVCLAQNAARLERVPAATIRRQVADVSWDLDRLDLEGFESVQLFRSTNEIAGAQIELATVRADDT